MRFDLLENGFLAANHQVERAFPSLGDARSHAGFQRLRASGTRTFLHLDMDLR